MNTITYPIRINKYLAYKNYGTRRDADDLIKKGRVCINEKKAVLGDMVQEGDEVIVKRRKDKHIKKFVYYTYNKPRGVITHSKGQGEIDIQTSIKRNDIFPIGRLDKDSEGLMILTNDGRLTDRLLNPENEHEKEYVVRVDKVVDKKTMTRLERGISIEGYKTKPAKVSSPQKNTLHITITEGKKHQIRRMLAAVGYTTLSLKRIRIQKITLGTLLKNEYREIRGVELEVFIKEFNLESPEN